MQKKPDERMLKIFDKKRSLKKKRKRGKKGEKEEREEKTEKSRNESILLTEVKVIPKKIEETENHKFLRKKLENLKFSPKLQIAINSGFEKAKDEIKEDLIDNYNINENTKINIY